MAKWVLVALLGVAMVVYGASEVEAAGKQKPPASGWTTEKYNDGALDVIIAPAWLLQ